MSLADNSGRLTVPTRAAIAALYSCFYQCVQCFCVSEAWYWCQCLKLFACVQMLVPAFAHGGCLPGSWLCETAIAAPGIRTCVGVAPGFVIGHTTNWAIPAAVYYAKIDCPRKQACMKEECGMNQPLWWWEFCSPADGLLVSNPAPQSPSCKSQGRTHRRSDAETSLQHFYTCSATIELIYKNNTDIIYAHIQLRKDFK